MRGPTSSRSAASSTSCSPAIRAFDGKSASSIMASVLAMTPKPMGELVPLSPPALDRIVSRCLAKDPEDRWQSARDVAAELEWVAQGGSRVGLPPIITAKRRVREGLAWGACALALLTAVGFAIAWAKRAPEPPPITRFGLPTAGRHHNPSSPEVSPDGRKVVFAASDADGKRQIWIAHDGLDGCPAPGHGRHQYPYVLVAGQPLHRVRAGGKLKKQEISGGPPQTICDAPTGSDGTWSADRRDSVRRPGQRPDLAGPASGGVAKVQVARRHRKRQSRRAGPSSCPTAHHFLFTQGRWQRAVARRRRPGFARGQAADQDGVARVCTRPRAICCTSGRTRWSRRSSTPNR